MAAKRKVVYRNRKAKKSRRRTGMKIPLAVVAGFMPLGAGIWQRKADPRALGGYVLGSLTGYQPGAGWNTQFMSEGALPILAGFTAHWLAGRLGVNRLLGRAGIPLIRI